MALTFIPNTVPSYIALSTDVIGGKITGAYYKGATVYLSDTQKSYLILDDLTLSEIPTGVTNYTTVEPSKYISGTSGSVNITTSTPVLILPSSGSGYKNYITSMLVTNSGSVVGTWVNFTSGSAGTVLWTGFATINGGGFASNLNIPISTSASTPLYCNIESGSAIVRVCVSGYKGA